MRAHAHMFQDKSHVGAAFGGVMGE